MRSGKHRFCNVKLDEFPQIKEWYQVTVLPADAPAASLTPERVVDLVLNGIGGAASTTA